METEGEVGLAAAVLPLAPGQVDRSRSSVSLPGICSLHHKLSSIVRAVNLNEVEAEGEDEDQADTDDQDTHLLLQQRVK